jgi:23S rRNA pseudouridine1911/1915/1917 synthase
MTRPPLILEVAESDHGQRLDRFLRDRLPEVSRGSLRRLIEARKVLVDGQTARKGQQLKSRQRVFVAAGDERPLPQPDMPLEVLAVTPAIVVIDKAPGCASHPLVPGELDTVANALIARYPECASASEQPREGGLVHRLDWGTSGVLIAARSRNAYAQLRASFLAGQIQKLYWALVHGRLEKKQQIDLPIESMPGDKRRVRVAPRCDQGQPASSTVRPIRQFTQNTLVEVSCHTGRRHQVRVHLAAIGHPLVGDTLYGGNEHTSLVGPFLHARAVELLDRQYEAPLPPARDQLLAALE